MHASVKMLSASTAVSLGIHNAQLCLGHRVPGVDLFTKEDQASAVFFPAARALVSILILDGIPCARSKSWLIVRARSTLIALQTQDALGLDQPLQEELASAIPEQPMWS